MPARANVRADAVSEWRDLPGANNVSKIDGLRSPGSSVEKAMVDGWPQDPGEEFELYAAGGLRRLAGRCSPVIHLRAGLWDLRLTELHPTRICVLLVSQRLLSGIESTRMSYPACAAGPKAPAEVWPACGAAQAGAAAHRPPASPPRTTATSTAVRYPDNAVICLADQRRWHG